MGGIGSRKALSIWEKEVQTTDFVAAVSVKNENVFLLCTSCPPDSPRHRLRAFTSKGPWERKLPGTDELRYTSMAVLGNEVLIADAEEACVRVFRADGTFLSTW